jgi:hypothetical protein
MSDSLEKVEKKRVKRITKTKVASSEEEHPIIFQSSSNLVTNANMVIQEEKVELYDEGESNVKVPKKRGRKPKGGKIIKPPTKSAETEPERPNIILHLKCSLSDVEDNIFSTSELKYDPMAMEKVNGFSFSNKKLPYEFIKPTEQTTIQAIERAYPSPIIQTSENNVTQKITFDNLTNYNNEYESENVKDIWKKLSELEISLHNNDISDKKSACFWDTCDFDNPPIYIPKYELNGIIHVYGCFCSPECAAAFLMKENIDTASKFERYHLLNHIYCKIYNYERNIKPAPNPFYTLNKYYGNLSTTEYRKLLKNERLLLIVDKPLTRQLPELHQDNDDFIINNNSIPSASKYKLRRGNGKPTKNSIVNENFGTK